MKLEEFLAGSARNAWIAEPGIKIYVRKGWHCIADDIRTCLDVANVEVHEKLQRQGIFNAWLMKAEVLATGRFDYVYVENVLNPHLDDYLSRRGYDLLDSALHCYAKRLTVT